MLGAKDWRTGKRGFVAVRKCLLLCCEEVAANFKCGVVAIRNRKRFGHRVATIATGLSSSAKTSVSANGRNSRARCDSSTTYVLAISNGFCHAIRTVIYPGRMVSACWARHAVPLRETLRPAGKDCRAEDRGATFKPKRPGRWRYLAGAGGTASSPWFSGWRSPSTFGGCAPLVLTSPRICRTRGRGRVGRGWSPFYSGGFVSHGLKAVLPRLFQARGLQVQTLKPESGASTVKNSCGASFG